MDPRPRERRFAIAGALVGLLALLFVFMPVIPLPRSPEGVGEAAHSPGSPATRAPREAPPPPAPPSRLDDSRAALRGTLALPNGDPAAGARVRIIGGGILGFLEVTADEDGRFVAPSLPSGFYEVQAFHGRFVAHAARGIQVRPNESTEIELQLVPGVAIDGRVVSARTGEGIGGAEVRIAGALLDIAPRIVETRADGSFTVPGLTPGPKVIRVHKDGFVHADPLEADPAEGEILVRLGTEARLEIEVLDPRGRPVPDAEAQLLVEGELSDDGSAPRSSDRLLVVPGPVPPIPISGSAPDARRAILASASSDSEGRVALRGLRAAEIRVRLSAEGRPTILGEPIELRPGQTSRARMTLPFGGTLAVQVFDADGARAEGAELAFRLEGDPIGAYARTDENGEVELEGVSGPIVIRASRGASPPAVRRVEIDEGERRALSITLDEAADELAGRVVDARGFGISGATLELETLSKRSPFEANVRTERDGTFRFGELPPPPYRVTVDHSAYAKSDAIRVDSIGEPLRVTLDPGGTVAGEVRDGRSLEPIPASLTLERGDRKLNRRAWPDGTFEIEHIPLGRWTLRVEDERYIPLERTFELVGGGPRPPMVDLGRIELVQGASVTGEVVDSVGEPLYRARIVVGRGDHPEARSDEGGRFAVSRVPPGRHRVVAVLDSGERVESAALALRDGEIREGIRLVARSRGEVIEVPTSPDARVGVPITVADEGGRVVIDWIAPEARSARRTLRVGDRILAIDGQEVMIAAQARALLRGEQRTLRIVRGGRTLEVRVPPERFTPP